MTTDSAERAVVTIWFVSAPNAADGDKVAFLVGAEGPGLRRKTMRLADARVQIPMQLGVDSLNVATSAAVAFYERIRN